MSNNKRTALRHCEYGVWSPSNAGDIHCGRPAVAFWDLTLDGTQTIYVCERHDEELSRMAEEDDANAAPQS